MKSIMVFLLLFVTCDINSQVYKKRIIYKYNYEISNSNNVSTGVIYLGCLGKRLPAKFDSTQMAVIWSEDIERVKRNIFGTGIIENNDRIWMHPPRSGKFSILEYSPFPEIKFPAKLNQKWSFSFKPGKNWINKTYNIKENDVLSYTYTIEMEVKKRYQFTPNLIKCHKVVADSQKDLNNTHFVGYYNSDYGFVEMSFKNIDGSMIRLTLNKVLPWVENINEFNNWDFK